MPTGGQGLSPPCPRTDCMYTRLELRPLGRQTKQNSSVWVGWWASKMNGTGRGTSGARAQSARRLGCRVRGAGFGRSRSPLGKRSEDGQARNRTLYYRRSQDSIVEIGMDGAILIYSKDTDNSEHLVKMKHKNGNIKFFGSILASTICTTVQGIEDVLTKKGSEPYSGHSAGLSLRTSTPEGFPGDRAGPNLLLRPSAKSEVRNPAHHRVRGSAPFHRSSSFVHGGQHSVVRRRRAPQGASGPPPELA